MCNDAQVIAENDQSWMKTQCVGLSNEASCIAVYHRYIVLEWSRLGMTPWNRRLANEMYFILRKIHQMNDHYITISGALSRCLSCSNYILICNKPHFPDDDDAFNSHHHHATKTYRLVLSQGLSLFLNCDQVMMTILISKLAKQNDKTHSPCARMRLAINPTIIIPWPPNELYTGYSFAQ